MHRSQPHPLPPLYASAWGQRMILTEPKGYFWTLHEVFAWADQNLVIDTVWIEDTLDHYPYRTNGRIYHKIDGGWVRERETAHA